MRLESGGLLSGGESNMHPLDQAIRAEVGIDDRDAAALLAVLDLHQPRLRPGRKYEHDPIQYDCVYCYNLGEGGPVDYPCETVERIAEALGVTP